MLHVKIIHHKYVSYIDIKRLYNVQQLYEMFVSFVTKGSRVCCTDVMYVVHTTSIELHLTRNTTKPDTTCFGLQQSLHMSCLPKLKLSIRLGISTCTYTTDDPSPTDQSPSSLKRRQDHEEDI
ncbi:hypothetical protein LSAT2_004678 [Lamellibrachia satsuma]|nr:hypothetical protein LSAT2_004678 [Lamellibrachia satsuma]